MLNKLGENKKVLSLVSRSGYKDYRLAWQIHKMWRENEWEQCDKLLMKLHKKTNKILEKRYFSFMRGETFFQSGEFDRAKNAYLESLHIGETVWMPDIDEYVSVFLCQDLLVPDIDTTYWDLAFGMDETETIRRLILKLVSVGKYEEIIKLCKAFDCVAYDGLFSYLYLASANIQLHKNHLAINQLEKLVSILPSHTGALKMLYELYRKEGLEIKADQVLGKMEKYGNFESLLKD